MTETTGSEQTPDQAQSANQSDTSGSPKGDQPTTQTNDSDSTESGEVAASGDASAEPGASEPDPASVGSGGGEAASTTADPGEPDPTTGSSEPDPSGVASSDSKEEGDPEDEEAEAPPLSWDDFDLPPRLRSTIEAMGWEKPTPVQARTFATMVEGTDVLVQSQTGSGKTGAFCLPWLASRFEVGPADITGVQLIVLLPTRELAKQVCNELVRLAADTPVEVLPVYGGTAMAPQLDALEAGVHAVVGTPGRILDHIRRRSLDLSKVRTVVLDECDEMLSMGFLEDIRAILSACPDERQTCLFSATVPRAIERIARRNMDNPVRIELSGDEIAAAEIDHAFYSTMGTIKTRDLLDVVILEDPTVAIVFCNTREETRLVANVLQKNGYSAHALSSDLTQAAREKVMAKFRDRNLRFLVATDVAARGIDVSHVSHVINYSFPENAEIYVHRTGRTGRAGRAGQALSIISPLEIGSFYTLKKSYKSIHFTERKLPPKDELAATRTEVKLDRISREFSQPVSPEWLLLARRLTQDPRGDRVVAYLLHEALEGQRIPGRAGGEEDEEEQDEGLDEMREGVRERGRGRGHGRERQGRDTRGRGRGRDRDRDRDRERDRDRRGRERDRGPERSDDEDRRRRRRSRSEERDRDSDSDNDQGERRRRRRSRQRDEAKTEDTTEDTAREEAKPEQAKPEQAKAPKARSEEAPEAKSTEAKAPETDAKSRDAESRDAESTDAESEQKPRKRRRRRRRRGRSSSDQDKEDRSAADEAEQTEGRQAEGDESQQRADGEPKRKRRRRRRRRGGGKSSEGSRSSRSSRSSSEGSRDSGRRRRRQRSGGQSDDDSSSSDNRVSQDEIVIDIDENELTAVRDEFGEIDELDELTLKGRRRAVLDDITDEVEVEDLTDRDAEGDEGDEDEGDEGDDDEGDDDESTESEAEEARAEPEAPASAEAKAKAEPEQPAAAESAESGASTEATRETEASAEAEPAAEPKKKKRRRRRRRKKAAPPPPELTCPPHKDFWEVWANKFSAADFEHEDDSGDESGDEDETEGVEEQARVRVRAPEPEPEPEPSSDVPLIDEPPDEETLVRVGLNIGRRHGQKAAHVRSLLKRVTGLHGKAVKDLTVRDKNTLFRMDVRHYETVVARLDGAVVEEVSLTLVHVDADAAAPLRLPDDQAAATVAAVGDAVGASAKDGSKPAGSTAEQSAASSAAEEVAAAPEEG